ncbi:hypothetical protein BVH74_18570 [Halopseudomonas phragmitis]|uniref:Uncharacterized protein n=2 Tax=Halopseudomonas phragmitis TaxID=1931241 RepID=A0A1V0B9P1_9GAMM|nr:hypothetical protein BVH74_18570 [Halopseudomonas phragmitis]
MADMDTALLETLKDGRVDFLTAAGSVAVEGLDAIVDTDVQRINEVSGFVDRVVTVCVSKAALGAYDRKGGVRSNSIEPVKYLVGKNWHLDGIASDDGDLITFYLVP